MTTSGLVEGRDVLSFRGWSVEGGPMTWGGDAWAEIEAHLRANDVRAAAALLRYALEAALRDMISRADGRAGTMVSLDVAGDLASVPRTVAIDLFRVAQECLTNAVRHAAARHICLAVTTAETAVSLDVEDDGGGDLDAVRGGTGHGLLGVRERIAALGGNLVVARAQAGLRIAATLPYALPAGGPAAA